MVFRLEFSREAERSLKWLAKRERSIFESIVRVLDDLERDPYQGKPLKGELKGRYSYRAGNYRILYAIKKHELLVLIIDIGHRRQIYR